MFHKISSFLLVAAIASLVACGADEGDDTEGFECSISVSPTEFQYAVVGDSLTFIQTGVASTMTVERQGSGNGLYGDWLLSAETDQYTGLSQRTVMRIEPRRVTAVGTCAFGDRSVEVTASSKATITADSIVILEHDDQTVTY